MAITCTIKPNGDLLVTCPPEDREDLADIVERRGYWSALSDIFENYSCNGGYTPFDAGDGNPFVGLTSAPCVAEAMDYPDNGEREIIGRFWWFPDYMVRDPIDEIAKRGETTFTLAS